MSSNRPERSTLAKMRALLRKRIYDNPYIPHDPTPKQIAFLSTPHREVLFGGAAGGGKVMPS